jgi:hypothetical protein
MTELVHERLIDLTDADGKRYDRVHVYAGLETTQSTIEGVAYWATGLEPIYFEGALERALRRTRPATPAAAAVSGVRVGTVRFTVETPDPDVPLRLMGTRTLVPGVVRRIHNGGALVYEGASRGGIYDFTAQFASENAAALLANTLWNELHGVAARLSVEDVEVAMRNAAIKDALTGALVH